MMLANRWGAIYVSRRAACRITRPLGKPRPPTGGATNLSLRPDVDTAVYVDRLACDVVTVFYQVADGPGDLFRFSEAAQGHLFAELLLGFLGDVGDHIGLYDAGADGVDDYAEAGQFLGGRL